MPELTKGKVLLHQGTESALEQEDKLLTRLHRFFESIHNTRFLIEVLALQAFLHDALGNEPEALERLERAISLAQPGGFIRLFVDLGQGLAKLLHRLKLDEEGLRYVGQILAAFKSDGPAKSGHTSEAIRENQIGSGQTLLEPLTKRELEIIGLLARHLTNQEIADTLFISVATVKSHTKNIYGKLGVNSRREAVAKTTGLSVL